MLSVERILAGLDTVSVGQNLVYLPETGSTNDELRRLARAGAPEGTLVIADYQSAGRGRFDRHWTAPPGSSLLMSLLFRPDLAPRQVQRLTMICGLAIADSIEAETGLHVGLKWPNDIVVRGGKAGGILTEIELFGDQLDYVAVGIGLNVNLDPTELHDVPLVPATSVSREVGRRVARLPLLWAFLRTVEARYQALQAGQSPYAEWAQRLVTVGQQVTVVSDREILEGIAEGVDANGALLVREANGRLKAVLAGDVTIRSQGHSSHA